VPNIQGSKYCKGMCTREVESPPKIKLGVVIALVAIAVIMALSAIAVHPSSGGKITAEIIAIVNGVSILLLITGIALATLGCRKKPEINAPVPLMEE
jgi:uncharacterized membrane protein YozB (DUF420 family)